MLAEGAEGEAPAEGAEAAASKDGDAAKKMISLRKVLIKSDEKKPAEKKPAEKIINMLLLVGLGNLIQLH